MSRSRAALMWLLQGRCRARRRIRRWPVVTSCPAEVKGRSRRRRSSQSLVLLVSAASASRPAGPARSARSPARSGSGSCGAGGDSAGRWPGRRGYGPRPGPAAGDGARARRSAAPGVGGETRQPHAVRIREPQLGPGVRPFLPDDQPHALGPAVQDVAGEFSDPGAFADLAVRLGGRRPGRCRNLQHMLVDRLGDHHADRVGQPPSPLSEPGDEVVGAARGVGADQGPAPAPVLLR